VGEKKQRGSRSAVIESADSRISRKLALGLTARPTRCFTEPLPMIQV
jgi:hypothetical protein